MAADIYDELPDSLKPASIEEGMRFSSESIHSNKPFGIHKYWVSLPPYLPKTRKLLEDCPESLGIFEVVYF